MTDVMATRAAFHEAGHAWAYVSAGRAIRYVTIRPRTPGCTGFTAVPRRRIAIGLTVLVAAAGPIAEAIHTSRDDDDGDFPLDWDDHLLGAVLAGGRHDAEEALGLLDDPGSVAVLRGELESDWHRIAALAAELLTSRTVDGHTAAAILTRGD